jgi:hypothetical protein
MSRNELPTAERLRGQRLRHVLRREPLHKMIEDGAQRSRREGPQLSIDGHAPPGVDRRGELVLFGENFEIGILDFEASSERVVSPLPIEDHARARRKGLLQPRAIPPKGADPSGWVARRELEDLQLPPFHGIAARNPHDDFKGGPHVLAQFRDARQVRAVFVPQRQIQEEILHGDLLKVGDVEGLGQSDSQRARPPWAKARDLEEVQAI